LKLLILFAFAFSALTLLVEWQEGQTTRVSRYQKGETNGICWAICKSASGSRQITTPAPHHSVFTDRMPFLPPNQQRQNTEGNTVVNTVDIIS